VAHTTTLGAFDACSLSHMAPDLGPSRILILDPPLRQVVVVTDASCTISELLSFKHQCARS